MSKKQDKINRIFSDSVYSPEAVKLAAAIFSERAAITLRRKPGATEATFPAEGDIINDFSNEVLNQQCRIDLSARNGRLSGIIVTKALLSASGKNDKRQA